MRPACSATLAASAAISVSALWVLKRVAAADNGMQTAQTNAKHTIGTRAQWLAPLLKIPGHDFISQLVQGE
jgi:hypothetical protein